MSTELQNNIHSLHRTGLALILGLVVALYGARGVAGAWRNTIDNILFFPRLRRLKQPRSTIRNIYIVLVGGGGLLLAASLSTRPPVWTIVAFPLNRRRSGNHITFRGDCIST